MITAKSGYVVLPIVTPWTLAPNLARKLPYYNDNTTPNYPSFFVPFLIPCTPPPPPSHPFLNHTFLGSSPCLFSRPVSLSPYCAHAGLSLSSLIPPTRIPSVSSRGIPRPFLGFLTYPLLLSTSDPELLVSLRGLKLNREDVYIPLMEGSHPKSVRQTSDPDAMALLSAPRASSHAPQDPLKAPESCITNIVNLDVTDFLLAGRHTSIPPGSSMDSI